MFQTNFPDAVSMARLIKYVASPQKYDFHQLVYIKIMASTYLFKFFHYRTMSLTHGLRPFAPRSAADLQVSDVIKFSRQGGKLSQGTIKFIGHLPGRGDIYLGVELDKEG